MALFLIKLYLGNVTRVFVLALNPIANTDTQQEQTGVHCNFVAHLENKVGELECQLELVVGRSHKIVFSLD